MNFIKLLVASLILMNKTLGMPTFDGFDILNKHELRNIKLNISLDNKKHHNYELETLKKMLEQSIQMFLNKFDDGNQTPLDIYYDIAALKFSNLEEKYKSNLDLETFLKSEFKSFINSTNTTLSLINKNEDNLTGFSLSHFWIFNLKIPQLSDFSFWCVISKTGTETPLVFGMN